MELSSYTTDKNSRLVYSTDAALCPGCKKELKKCGCPATIESAADNIVRVSRQTKGRKGSGVSIITGVPLAGAELKKLAKTLKQKCGSGGTVKNGVIEIQGDHRDTLVAELKKKGWQVKRAGG